MSRLAELPKRRRTALLSLVGGFLVLFLLGTLVIRPRMERDLQRKSLRALQQDGAGYAKEVSVEFSGQDATVTGEVDTEADAEEVARLVGSRHGVRTVHSKLTIARPDLIDKPSEPVNGSATSVAADDLKVIASLAPIEVTFRDGSFELAGTVPDDKSKNALLDRITATFAEEDVKTQRLLIAGRKSSKDEQQAYARVGSFLADMPRLGVQEGVLKLSAGRFEFNGRVPTRPDVQRLEEAMVAIVGSRDKVQGRVTTSNQVGTSSSAPVAGASTSAPSTVAGATTAPATVAGAATTAGGPTTSTVALTGEAAAIDQKVRQQLASSTITFEPNSTRLTSEGESVVDALALSIGEANVKIEVRAYTDDRGSAGGNLRVSQKRAQAVKDRFVQQGIPSSRITARGLGEADPVADNATPEGQAKNRRVEIGVANL